MSNTSGSDNSAFGYESLYSNNSGYYNSAFGWKALYNNKAGSGATAIGYFAMYYANNTTSAFDNNNVAVGFQALRGSTDPTNNTGNYNTAVGREALMNNSSGSYNSTFGYESLYNNTTGYYNSAFGWKALQKNNSGDYNCAFGIEALFNNTAGNNNTAIGFQALDGISTQDNNTALGYGAYSDGNYTNSAGIGYDAEPGASNKIMIGNTSVTWIGGHSTWHNTSDARIKNNVKEDVKGLDFIMKLRPVTYNIDKDKLDALIGTVDSSDYAEKYDVEKIKQSGFLAQEVEQAAQESGYDFSGVSKPKGDVKYYSLAYSEFVVPLVKATQEQQRTIEEQKEQIQQQQNQIQELKAQNAEILKRLEALEKK